MTGWVGKRIWQGKISCRIAGKKNCKKLEKALLEGHLLDRRAMEAIEQRGRDAENHGVAGQHPPNDVGWQNAFG